MAPQFDSLRNLLQECRSSGAGLWKHAVTSTELGFHGLGFWNLRPNLLTPGLPTGPSNGPWAVPTGGDLAGRSGRSHSDIECHDNSRFVAHFGRTRPPLG